MRVVITALVTAIGIVAASHYPVAYWIAVGICWAAFLLLMGAQLGDRRASPSLRHAVLGAFACAVTATIIVIVITVGDVPFETRAILRIAIVAVVTAPAIYWLLLLVSGGFRRKNF